MIKNVITWSVVFVVLLLIGIYYTFISDDEDKQCLKGCRVVQLIKYTGHCLPYHTVYVTECAGKDVITDPKDL